MLLHFGDPLEAAKVADSYRPVDDKIAPGAAASLKVAHSAGLVQVLAYKKSGKPKHLRVTKEMRKR